MTTMDLTRYGKDIFSRWDIFSDVVGSHALCAGVAENLLNHSPAI